MDLENEEDDSPEFQQPPHPSLPLTLQKEQHYDCYMLVIAQHGSPALFAHSLIGPASTVNRLNFSKAKQSSLADLYIDCQKTLFIIFNDQMPPMREVYFTKFLETNIRCQRVVLLMSVPRNTLHDTTCPPLTCISTRALTETVTLPHFQEGIQGIEAQVVAWGERNEVPVCGFMATMKEYELTSEIVEEAFGLLRGKYGLKGHFDIVDRVKKYNIGKSSNRLYL